MISFQLSSRLSQLWRCSCEAAGPHETTARDNGPSREPTALRESSGLARAFFDPGELLSVLRYHQDLSIITSTNFNCEITLLLHFSLCI